MSSNNREHEDYDHELPLKNIAQVEEGTEPENATNGVVIDNRRQKRKLRVRKFLICLVVSLVIVVAVTLPAYFLLRYLSKGNESKILQKPGTLMPPNVEIAPPPSSSILHVFQSGAVCSDNDVCSNIGRDIFHRGGNAVDSALATLFCNGIATMQSLGIGGGFLMNVFIKRENKAYTIDAREVAPLVASEDMFVERPRGASMQGPLSIATPGEVMGYWEAHKRFATMTWKEIIEPSIKVCQDGIILTKHMSDAIHANKNVKIDPNLRRVFVNETNGEFYRIGALIHPPKELCESYKLLTINGAMDFYNGTLAKMIAADLKDIGSIITAEDLEAYNVNWHYSIPIQVDSDTLHVVPPVGSGTILAFIINILRGYNMSDESMSTPDAIGLTYHRFIEAYKFAFGRRFELGDSRFNNLTQLINNLTSPEFGESIRKKIDDTKTFDEVEHYGAHFWSKPQTGTSHLSVLAPNGDAVSVTSTINFYFGSGNCGRRTGIIFNSGMDDFSSPGMQNWFGLPASEPNFIRPQKRAMSSMCPTIITNKTGDVKLVIGAAGGTKILTSVAWVIARVLWFGQDIKQAIDAPRIHHQLVPNEVMYEYGVLQSVINMLKARGHKTQRYHERGSTMCGIAKNTTAVYANADYRKKGEVYGL